MNVQPTQNILVQMLIDAETNVKFEEYLTALFDSVKL